MTPALRRCAAATAAATAAVLLVSCPSAVAPEGEVVLTYTFVSGDPTREILEALGDDAGLAGIEVKPLTVPQEVLLREPYVLSLSTGSTAIDAYLLDAPWVKSYSGASWLAPIAGGEAQALVKRACSEAAASDRHLMEVLAELSGVPVDWRALSDPVAHLGAAEALIDRILAEAEV